MLLIFFLGQSVKSSLAFVVFCGFPISSFFPNLEIKFGHHQLLRGKKVTPVISLKNMNQNSI
jgi:hypothetical protein